MKENKNEKFVMIHQSKLIDFEENPLKVVFDEIMLSLSQATEIQKKSVDGKISE